MVALSGFDYDGQRLANGNEFLCYANHAKLLKIVGKARDADEEKQPAKEEVKVDAPKKKRAYRRRDMRAE
jgi:hypothetical protein